MIFFFFQECRGNHLHALLVQIQNYLFIYLFLIAQTQASIATFNTDVRLIFTVCIYENQTY